MINSLTLRISAWGAFLLAAALLVLFAKGFLLFQLTIVMAYAAALIGLNLLTGYNGQISLGHGAFFAIGAYTAGILMDNTAVPYWLAVPAAGVVCLGFGYAFGTVSYTHLTLPTKA